MNTPFLIIVILAVVAGIFFIWGTIISSVKHVGAGGIFLTIAIICMFLFGTKL